MKTPRVEDFDPAQSTLELGTPLDGMPSIHEHKAHDTRLVTPEVPSATLAPLPTPSQSLVRPSGVSHVRTAARRTITRYAFEFFQDQVESLRRFSLGEKARGEKGSMSQMVREALDMYIAKRNRTEE